jgi:recombination protein RecR
MSALDKLIRQFERFPGIGSRQAKRFAFHLLTISHEDAAELGDLIRAVRSSVTLCPSCQRFFSREGSQEVCAICGNANRDNTKLVVVERDSDIDAIERSGIYDGFYFVLGGTVPLLDTQDVKKLRGAALKRLIEMRGPLGLREVILGFSVNPDGENTSRYIEILLKENIEKYKLRISHLGRGLSTGSELEYADPETIKNALKNRS